MSVISKTIRDRTISGKFSTFCLLKTTPLGLSEIFETFPNFGCHLEFRWKWKMSFSFKTVTPRAVLSKHRPQWIIRTTDLIPVNYLEFS